MKTTCCIVGGGPAGMMLGFLLARAGVPVIVLEKHGDFFRDFRGDTIHPSTLQVLHELGLLERFLASVPHSTVQRLSLTIGGQVLRMADFSHLPTVCKYIALAPQWDFLNFLAAEAAHFPAFNLKMNWEAIGLLRGGQRSDDRVTGVLARTPHGEQQIEADLVVGCDGRHAVSRDAANLQVIEQGVPIDVLWFRVPRHPDDPENALGYVNFGRALILINRNDYFQAGFIIAKGAFPGIQQAGLDAFRESIERLAPFLTGRLATLDAGPPDPWANIKLLTVQINHLAQWFSPGILCIGDAAHAMSPVGGIGINIALQDAVATANLLEEPLRTHTLTPHHLQAVQHHRERAVLRTQRLQAAAHRVLNGALSNPGPLKPPVLLKLLTHTPGFQRVTGRIVGMGFQPEHVKP